MHGRPHSRFQATILLCAVGVGLWFAPPSIADVLRNGVRDALLPGRWVAIHLREVTAHALQHIAGADQHARQIDGLTSELEQSRQTNRRQQWELAALAEKLQRNEKPSPLAGTTGEPLIVSELIAARVLGDEAAALWRAGRLLNAGTDAAQESAWVLSDDHPLLDQGEPSGFAPEQPVYAGRSVIGKIHRVGHWTSTFLPLTDPRYRGGAQLVRETDEGPVFGATGILKGTGGATCLLERIPPTAPVSVGESVYTGGSDDLLPVPMYYGKVVAAEQLDGSREWRIEVEPAVDPAHVHSVQILRAKLNRARAREIEPLAAENQP